MEHPGDRTGQGIEESIDDQGVEFVRKGARWTMTCARRDIPQVVEVALGGGALEVNRDATVGREIVDGKAGEHRFGPQDTQRRLRGEPRGLGHGATGSSNHEGSPFLLDTM